MAVGRTAIASLEASDGSQLVSSVEPVRADGEIAGALLRFRLSGDAGRGTRKERVMLGRESLTDTELALAELVGEASRTRRRRPG